MTQEAETKEELTIEQVNERLAKIRQARDAAEKDIAQKEARLELALSSEVGTRGTDFDIVRTHAGLVAVVRRSALLVKQLKGSKMKDEDFITFVKPHVIYPKDRDFVDELADKYPFAITAISDAVCKLYDLRIARDAAK